MVGLTPCKVKPKTASVV